MQPLAVPPPVLVLPLLPDERARLLALLADLDEASLQRPTRCEGWSVKDIALHLLGDDLGVLSRLRDRFDTGSPAALEDLVDFVNRLNAVWVQAARRLSRRVLCDLLGLTGRHTYDFFASLDPFEPSQPVSWAGPGPAPAWLGIAREYTERWIHQQQIREALGAPPLYTRQLFAPVLATLVHALPRTFAGLTAPPDTAVSLVVEGDSGGQWTVVRTESGSWRLYAGVPSASAALVRLGQDTAWRLFTRGIDPPQAAERSTVEGDARLGARLLETVAILA